MQAQMEKWQRNCRMRSKSSIKYKKRNWDKHYSWPKLFVHIFSMINESGRKLLCIESQKKQKKESKLNLLSVSKQELPGQWEEHMRWSCKIPEKNIRYIWLATTCINVYSFMEWSLSFFYLRRNHSVLIYKLLIVDSLPEMA